MSWTITQKVSKCVVFMLKFSKISSTSVIQHLLDNCVVLEIKQWAYVVY